MDTGPIFAGTVAVEPPLNEHEVAYLRRFAGTRRMYRRNGPYYTGRGSFGEEDEADIIDHNEAPPEQHGLWCHWRPTEDGTGIEWDGAEKFFAADGWMSYLISTFLKPGADLQAELANPIEGRYYAPEFEHFTFDHAVSGVIEAVSGYERWQIVVDYNIAG
jgi:hypothetical protein